MDPMIEELLDYGEGELRERHGWQYRGNEEADPASDDEQHVDDDDDFGNLYDDVNIVVGFDQNLQHIRQPPSLSNGVESMKNGEGFKGPGSSQYFGSVGAEINGNSTRANSVYPKAEEAGSVLMELNHPHLNSPVPKVNASFNAASRSENSTFQIELSQLPATCCGNGINPVVQSISSPLPVNLVSATKETHPHSPTNQLVGSETAVNGTSTNSAFGPVNSNGTTAVFVGELHWWTTDSDVESIASQFGRVKEIRFFNDRACGKSKGYCQVDFHDPISAARCKEGMDGYVFNGRACVVRFASAQTLREMGANHTRRNQNQNQTQSQYQGRGNTNDGGGRNGLANDGSRNHGRGGRGRGMMSREQESGGPIRVRRLPGFTGPFGQSHGSMLHPQTMMASGFDPNYMGFHAPNFSGMMPQFQTVNSMGLTGVAPHVNPAFFGQGMITPNGVGEMGSGGMNGNITRVRMDTVNESNVKELTAESMKEEAINERKGRSHASSGDKGSQHDEREHNFKQSSRDQYREENDCNSYHRNRGHYDDRRDRDQASSRSRSRLQKDRKANHGFRPRERDYGKRSHD